MSDTTYKSKVGYKPPVELEYHEGTPEIKSVMDHQRDVNGKILDQVEEYVVARCSVAVGVKIDREELIKALRYDRGQYEKGYADGKRDAIDRMEEALQAAEPTERQVVDYCHKRCLVVLEADLFHELKASYGKTPKRGEWIEDRTEIVCSKCHARFSDEIIFMNRNMENEALKYCPNCGAKMEVQE